MNADESLVLRIFKASFSVIPVLLWRRPRGHMKVGKIKSFLYVVNQYLHYVPFAFSLHKISDRRFKIYEKPRTG